MKNSTLMRRVEKSKELKIEIIKFMEDNNLDSDDCSIKLEIVNGKNKIFVVLVGITNNKTSEVHKFGVTMRNNAKGIIVLSREVNALMNNLIKVNS